MAALYASMHKLLYDRKLSNVVGGSPITQFLETSGLKSYKISPCFISYSFEEEIPQAAVVGYIDHLANVMKSGTDRFHSYGVRMLFVTCTSSLFDSIYRTWERFIKYERLIGASKSTLAAKISELSKKNIVLEPATHKDVNEENENSTETDQDILEGVLNRTTEVSKKVSSHSSVRQRRQTMMLIQLTNSLPESGEHGLQDPKAPKSTA
jgi:hypothetical protein